MKVLKRLLSLVVLILLASIIFTVSLFLGLRGNIIFSISIVSIGIGCFSFAVWEFVKKKYSAYYFYILGVILISSLCFVEFKNMKALKEVPQAVTVCSAYAEIADSKKRTEEYDRVFKIKQYENIKLYYHPNVESALKLIENYLSEAEKNTAKLLPKSKKEILTIKLDYDEDVFRKIYPERMDSQGFYIRADNRINILVADCYSDILSVSTKSDHFKDTLLHEYSHYKLRQFADYNKLSLDNIPTWFNEGLASYIGAEGARQPNEPKTLIPFKDLQEAEDWTKHSNETKGSVYTEADYAVSELIFIKGENVIQEILLKTKTLNFKTAFKTVVGITLEEYEKELEADMKKGWRKYHRLIPEYHPPKEDALRIECLEDYVKTNTSNIYAYYDLQMLYYKTGNYDKAEDIKNKIGKAQK